MREQIRSNIGMSCDVIKHGNTDLIDMRNIGNEVLFQELINHCLVHSISSMN